MRPRSSTEGNQKQNEEQNEEQNENEEVTIALVLITFGAASRSQSLISNHPHPQQKRKQGHTGKHQPRIIVVTQYDAKDSNQKDNCASRESRD